MGKTIAAGNIVVHPRVVPAHRPVPVRGGRLLSEYERARIHSRQREQFCPRCPGAGVGDQQLGVRVEPPRPAQRANAGTTGARGVAPAQADRQQPGQDELIGSQELARDHVDRIALQDAVVDLVLLAHYHFLRQVVFEDHGELVLSLIERPKTVGAE